MKRAPAIPEQCKAGCDLHCLFESEPPGLEPLPAAYRAVLHRWVESGEFLYRAGEKPRYITGIQSGLVKLIDHTVSGVERILYLAGRGNTIGLEGLLDQPMRATAVALRPTCVCRIPVELLRAMGGRDPELYRRLMSHWQQSLDFARNHLVQFSSGPTEIRIARLIAFRAQLERNRGDGEITLLSRQDMAALLGVTPESICRVIARFKRAKLLRKIRRDVYLCDLAAIQSLAAAEAPSEKSVSTPALRGLG